MMASPKKPAVDAAEGATEDGMNDNVDCVASGTP
jgi:hypothetical protein